MHITIIILTEILKGLFQSINIIKLSKLTFRNVNLQRNMWKLLKHNSIFYILPGLIMYLIDISDYYFYYAYIPIELFSGFIHMLYYFDISTTINNSITSRPKKDTADPMTNGLTMTLYQITMIILIGIFDIVINFINPNLSIIIKFLLLSIYHAVFAHNNLWQCIGLGISQRIDIYQKMWPYYFGYGIIASCLYLQTNIFLRGIYNIYVGILISVSLLNKMVLPTTKMQLPEINLKLIEYMMVIIYNTVSYIVENVIKIIN